MMEQGTLLEVTVVTSDGKVWGHRYPLPADTNGRRAVVEGLSRKIPVLNQPAGIIFLENPSAVYTVPNILRFSWHVSGPTAESVELRELEKEIGLNIDR